VDQWINRMRPKLARVPGATLFLQPVQDVTIGGRIGNAQFQYTLLGDNLQDLLTWAPDRGTEAEGPSGNSRCEQRSAESRITSRLGYRPRYGWPPGNIGIRN
jgi:multidrug efflux pump subunit AcrB